MFDFIKLGYNETAIGVLLMVLGCSFAYKFFLASVLGKVSYWQGFLPITVVSPLLTHLPSGEKSLVKKTQGIWVHLVMSPIFLICTVLCLSVGADLAGLPGVETLNWVLNGGDYSKPPAVQFNHITYKLGCPLLVRATSHIGKMISKLQIPESDKDKLPDGNKDGTGSYDSAVSNSSG